MAAIYIFNIWLCITYATCSCAITTKEALHNHHCHFHRYRTINELSLQVSFFFLLSLRSLFHFFLFSSFEQAFSFASLTLCQPRKHNTHTLLTASKFFLIKNFLGTFTISFILSHRTKMPPECVYTYRLILYIIISYSVVYSTCCCYKLKRTTIFNRDCCQKPRIYLISFN